MPEPAKGNNFRIFIIIILVVAGYYVYQKYLKTTPSAAVLNGPVIYDTNPQNDAFIKGSLTSQQMAQFDKILEFEKTQSSMRLSQDKLKELAGNDLALYEAYIRWRKCVDMMRSTHHIVYPSERKFYQKK